MADTTKNHVVKSGETLGRIAQDNEVTVEEIRALNPDVTDPNKIFAGQTILIPVKGEGQPEASTGTGSEEAVQPLAPGAVITGMDANLPLKKKHIDCLRLRGFRFAVRYYTRRDRTRTLTLDEAKALVTGGFQLGAVFEDGFPGDPNKQPAFFTHERGVGDAQAAHDRASNKIGQPANSTIYFGVDFDASQKHIDSGITHYFEGVREAFLAANSGTLKYHIGVYGSGLTCTQLLKKGLATFAWLSQSTDHQGSKQFKQQKLYNLVQGPRQKNVCELDEIDGDETNPDPVKFPSGLFTIPV